MSMRRSRGADPRPPSRVVGVCDLGTFSALILIAQLRRGSPVALAEERHTVDLARGRDRYGALSEAAICRATRVLRRFDALTRRFHCDATAAVGTAALRAASGRSRLLRRLHVAGRHPVTVLSAPREAELAALGARSGLPPSTRSVPVVDVGGGSIEVVDPAGQLARGFRVGAATATVSWAAGSPRRRSERAAYFRRLAQRRLRRLVLLPRPSEGFIIGVGGTMATLAALAEGRGVFDPAALHGKTLTAEWVNDVAETLATLPTADIAAMIAFDPARARILTAGTFLWAEVINRLCVRRVIVSVRGLRWGAAIRLVSGDLASPTVRGRVEIT
ncbi:MAG TPA: hypothetical protein VM118_05785 [Acidobacteriota bacterium]|nr:hypothetical protein [Acidobacteriota bacterium]